MATERDRAVSPRRLARRYAVLGLYQWQMTGQNPGEIALQFGADEDWLRAVAAGIRGGDDDKEVPVPSDELAYEQGHFQRLMKGVPSQLAAIDAQLATVIDRAVEQVDPVERAILRLGAFELLFCPDVPYQVTINEAVNLAKLLGAEQGHRYVNGVLDKIAQALRAQPSGGGVARRQTESRCPSMI